MVCKDCRYVHIVTAEDQPLSIVPDRSIALAQMEDSSCELAQGTPLVRSTDGMKEAGQLGKDTITRTSGTLQRSNSSPLTRNF